MEKSDALHKGSVISAMFLVGGTCIGGGMLALPIATGISGFLPSLAIMAVCWLAMTFTALLLLEVTLWMEEGAHVISMTSRLLGTWGKAAAWVIYLFICYASIVAYTAGGGMQITRAAQHLFSSSIPHDIGCLIFVALFGSVIYFGSFIVGRVNAILFVAMIGAYVALVVMGLGEVKLDLLANRNWRASVMAVPLLLTSFSFQTMVPSLTPYLKRNAKGLRLAIIGGTTIAFLVYAIWQWLILGIVPVEGEHGLAEALSKGEPATQFLHVHVVAKWMSAVAEYFAFFAIVTSFLGMGLGLHDFLADGLRIPNKGWGKAVLGLLIVVPTLIFATQFERVFLLALDTSGGFGDSILNGMLPVLMVWIGRYKLGFTGYRVWGGKFLLVAVFSFFVLTLVLEILAQFGHISSIYDFIP